jgi:hypothetical protein
VKSSSSSRSTFVFVAMEGMADSLGTGKWVDRERLRRLARWPSAHRK